ncbi:MAG: ribosomal protein S18-alanine N-acetyltransferase [Clostridiales bacterium]|nr:ribosomal protein S18-alanine N-acetyltransferase [Candidatus Crickella merdequi]
MSETVIRMACADDAEAVAAIERATSDTPWSITALAKDISDNSRAIVLVASVNGDVIGYADVWCIAGEAELNNIGVLEGYRGRHIGQALLEEAIRKSSASCQLMNLEVRAGNNAAISLYEKLGFVRNGLRKNYYENNGEDAVLMTAEIGNV